MTTLSACGLVTPQCELAYPKGTWLLLVERTENIRAQLFRVSGRLSGQKQAQKETEERKSGK